MNHLMLLQLIAGLMEKVRREEEGQTAVEYALVLVLIALVLAGALATGLNGVLNDVITTITNAI
ncbi:MAG TPA: Flp family type IVb pilin [Solirubrobacteraceae bacterium]|nr:Flp family type IVb pilin [Solirubrobacteraceae bacterium]